MNTATPEEVVQSVFSATPENRYRALLILQGKEPKPKSDPVEGPLLMSMGEAAKFLNVSRGTLWRMVKEGRLEKVEIYSNAFRLRRSDILALVNGKEAARG